MIDDIDDNVDNSKQFSIFNFLVSTSCRLGLSVIKSESFSFDNLAKRHSVIKSESFSSDNLAKVWLNLSRQIYSSPTKKDM